ncbi:MAG TPA: hypothetical protein VGJ26_22220 [Pirellulales bacterium]|jgi:hypothetical protein
MSAAEAKLFAMAINEIRSLVGCVAGNDSPYELRLAWRLAYALHNDAFAVVEGRSFNLEASLSRVAEIDGLLGGNDGRRIADEMRQAIS